MGNKNEFFRLKKELFEVSTSEQLRILKFSIDKELEKRLETEESKYFKASKYKLIK